MKRLNVTEAAIVAIAYGQAEGYSKDDILLALGPDAPPIEEADAEFDAQQQKLGADFTANDLRMEIGRILAKPLMSGNEGFGVFNSAVEAAEHCIQDSREIGMSDEQILRALGPKDFPSASDDALDDYLTSQKKTFTVKDLRREIARLVKN